MKAFQTHYRTCNLCEAMCGLEITHANAQVLSIKGDKKDPFSQGHICPKAVALKDIYKDKDRLKTPIKRTDQGWIDISWEQAYKEVTDQFKNLQKNYGPNALGVYRGNPNVHNLGLMLFGGPFLKSLGTQQKYSAQSVDQLPHHLASLFMFGHQMMIPIPDIDHTDFMLIIGANPVVSNGSMMTAANFSKKLKDLKKRGGQFIVIDPRATETAKLANKHYFIKPGRDVLLLLSIIHILCKEKLCKDRLKPICLDFDKINKVVAPYSPEQTASMIGIEAEQIKLMAITFANAKKAVCYGRLGVSTQEFGGLCQWLINVLNIITDNLDSPGGAMFTLPAIDMVGMSRHTGKTGAFDRRKSRVQNLPEFSGEYPVATLADEIIQPGEGQIKAMITIGGNPVLSTPNGKRLAKAFKQLEYMVAIDIYVNETTQFADIILPSTTGLETSHYDIAFNQLSVRNTAKYAGPCFEKAPDQRHDWEILKELTLRMTGKKNPANPESILDQLLKAGPYKQVSLEQLKDSPHGIDLGPLKSCLPERLFTKDQKIQLCPALFLEDLNRLQKQMTHWKEKTVQEFPFSLVGRRHLRSNNSWMRNAKSLMTGRDRCTLLINPLDAKKLTLNDKQKVKVTSNIGSIKVAIEFNDEMMPGVLSLPHGWGHANAKIKMELAKKNRGVSINDLTDSNRLDRLSGNADFSSTRVKIEA